ncbi:MAG: LexA family transcriptional regulator [Methylocystaceae bacterium]|nr:LexA family transcriptional regulator [Methylocystaceae bacterium]
MIWWDRLKYLMEEGKLSMAELSRRSEIPYDNLAKYMKGKVDNPRGDTLRRLAEAVGTTEYYLRGGEDLEAIEQPAITSRGNTLTPPAVADAIKALKKSGYGVRPIPDQNESESIPIFAAVESHHGEMIVDNQPIDYVPRPWYLKQIQDGYAVVVVGESMSPVYEPGNLIIVNPKAPLVREKDAIFIRRRDGDRDWRASLKRLVRQTSTHWIVRQFNAPEGQTEEIMLDKTAWPEAKRVVGKYDGG